MDIDRMRELPDMTLISCYSTSFQGKELDDCATVLRERGYVIKGFSWGKPEEKDPIEEMRKKIYGE